MAEQGEPLFRGITRLENELLVRDFVEVLTVGDARALEPFLHRDVKFSGMAGACATGKHAVLSVCEQIFAEFPVFTVDVVAIASVDSSVLVEEELRVGLRGGVVTRRLSGFASFGIEDFQILSWHQVHG